MYPTYAGTSGRQQGDAKETIPPRKATAIPIARVMPSASARRGRDRGACFGAAGRYRSGRGARRAGGGRWVEAREVRRDGRGQIGVRIDRDDLVPLEPDVRQVRRVLVQVHEPEVVVGVEVVRVEREDRP